VVLHERSGSWAGQLRPRLGDVPARWFETRSTVDLLAAVAGRASPVVLIEAGTDAEPALRDLTRVAASASAPLILFLDPRARPEVLRAARELGATLAETGRITPPEAADHMERWIGLAARAIEREGWTRAVTADPSREPDEWVDEIVAEAAAGAWSWSPEPVSTTMGSRSDRDRRPPS
jgi:hypothetical protein